MFKILFAVFALLAAAFAAPSANPNPNPAVVAAPVAYSALGYTGGYVAPVAYSSYSHVVPSAYAYGTPVVYG